LAHRAGRMGGTHPAVLNAANEEAVGAFLAGAMAFTEIPVMIEKVLDEHETLDGQDLDAVLEADSWARARAREVITKIEQS